MTLIQAKGGRRIQASSRAIQAFGSGETVIVGGAVYIDWDAFTVGGTPMTMTHARNVTTREPHSVVGFLDNAATNVIDDHDPSPSNILLMADVPGGYVGGCSRPVPTGWTVNFASRTGRLSWSKWPLVDQSNPLGIRPDKIRVPLAVKAYRSATVLHGTEWCASWPDTPLDSDVQMWFGGQKGKPEYSSGLFVPVDDGNYVVKDWNTMPFPPVPLALVSLNVLKMEVDTPDLYNPATTNGPEDLTDDQIVFFHEFVHLDLTQALTSIYVPVPPLAHNPPLGINHHRRLDVVGGSSFPGMGPNNVEYIYL